MRTIEIKINGETESDLMNALEEVKRLIHNGYYSGSDSNETGSFEFEEVSN